MRDDYLANALQVIPDRYILVNVVSLRVKQLRRGHRPLVESLERLTLEDTALREIAERKITFELPAPTSATVHETSRTRRPVSFLPAEPVSTT